MLFNSYTFLFAFLPPVALGVWGLCAVGRRTFAKLLLFAASLLFYGWFEPRALLLLLPLLAFNYGVARLLLPSAPSTRGWPPARRTALLVGGLLVNLSALAFFKYAGFVLGLFGHRFHVLLPLGLSFITFQKIALLVDVYAGEVEAIDLVDYCLFVSFFPQLIAGPIVHHKEVIPQFARPASLRFDAVNVAGGLALLAIGLFKKVVLADGVAPLASAAFAAAARGPVDAGTAWTAALAYTPQLYFDFSGYCDAAVGLGMLFGVRLPLNFDSPLKATGIIEFWQRWHMTLTRFLNAYLYNPIVLRITRWRMARGARLGGRKMTPATFLLQLALPTMVTMTLAGIWHGAGFGFLVFGALHGVYLVLNHLFRTLRGKRKGPAPLVERLGGQALTVAGVVVAFVFFRAESLGAAGRVLAGMAHLGGLSRPARATLIDVVAPVAALWAIALVLPNAQAALGRLWTSAVEDVPAPRPAPGVRSWPSLVVEPSVRWGVALALGTVVVLARMTSSSEFLYFNF